MANNSSTQEGRDQSHQPAVVVEGDVHAEKIIVGYLPTENPVQKFRMVSPPIHCFYGRQDDMLKLSQALDSCKNRATWTESSVLVKGIGGIGKSDLVRMFVKKHRSIYKNVAWINSENEDAVIASFQELGAILKLCPPGGGSVDPKQLAHSIYRHVAQHVECPLFVFDNAVVLRTEGDQFGILDWLPTLQLDRYPQIIITSQSTEWETINMKNILLEPLEILETVDFYKNYFKLTARVLDEELQQQLEVLSALVQGLPLAMIMSASCMKFYPDRHSLDVLQRELEVAIDLFQAPGDNILAQKIGQFMPAEYAHTMATVWKRSLERIGEHENGPVSFHLLYMLAYLPSTGAPEREVIKVDEIQTATEAQAGAIQKPEDKVFRGKRTLKKFCLVAIFEHTFFKESLRVHRLVQKMVRSDPQSLTAVPKILRHIECRELYYESNLRPIYEAALTNKLIHVDVLPSYVMVTCDLLVNSNKFGDKFMACLKQWTPRRHERPSGKVVTSLESDLLSLGHLVDRINEEDELLNVNETIREAVTVGKKWRPCVNRDTRRVQYLVLDVILMLTRKFGPQLRHLERKTIEALNDWLVSFPVVDDDDASGLRYPLKMSRIVTVFPIFKEASTQNGLPIIEYSNILKLPDPETVKNFRALLSELNIYSLSDENFKVTQVPVTKESYGALQLQAEEIRKKYLKDQTVTDRNFITSLLQSVTSSMRSGNKEKLKEMFSELKPFTADAGSSNPIIEKLVDGLRMLQTSHEKDGTFDFLLERICSNPEEFARPLESLANECVQYSESGELDQSEFLKKALNWLSNYDGIKSIRGGLSSEHSAVLEDTLNKGGVYTAYEAIAQTFEQPQTPSSSPCSVQEKVNALIRDPDFDPDGSRLEAVQNDLRAGKKESYELYFKELKERISTKNDPELLSYLEIFQHSLPVIADPNYSDPQQAVAQVFRNGLNDVQSGDVQKSADFVSLLLNVATGGQSSSSNIANMGPLTDMFQALSGSGTLRGQFANVLAADPSGFSTAWEQGVRMLSSFMGDSPSQDLNSMIGMLFGAPQSTRNGRAGESHKRPEEPSCDDTD